MENWQIYIRKAETNIFSYFCDLSVLFAKCEETGYIFLKSSVIMSDFLEHISEW